MHPSDLRSNIVCTVIKIDIACGGTGGHLLPGLVTGEELQRRGHDVTLWLTGREIENAMIQGWCGGSEIVSGRGFVAAVRAVWYCRGKMRARRPDVVLAMGGYGSIGPTVAAKLLGCPVVLHEANVIPGRAVKFMARFASAVAVAFEGAVGRLRHSNLTVTGMPLRPGVVQVAEGESAWPSVLKERGLISEKWTLLVLGGSQGAHRLNTLIPAGVAAVKEKGRGLQVVHLAGARDLAAVENAYRNSGIPAAVFAFHEKIEELYAAADYAVCRAGAATCAELQACGLPALLIPYPHAQDNHQLANAQAIAEPDHIEIALEATLSEKQLAIILGKRVGVAKTDREAGSAAGLHRDAAQRLAGLVETVKRSDR